MSFSISRLLDTHLRRSSTLSRHQPQNHLQASMSPMTFNCFLDKAEHSSWNHWEHMSHIIANWPSRSSTSHFLQMRCNASSFVVHSALWFHRHRFGRSLNSTRAPSYRHATIAHLFNKFITTIRFITTKTVWRKPICRTWRTICRKLFGKLSLGQFSANCLAANCPVSLFQNPSVVTWFMKIVAPLPMEPMSDKKSDILIHGCVNIGTRSHQSVNIFCNAVPTLILNRTEPEIAVGPWSSFYSP